MELSPFGLERFFARHEFSARHLLCASDCESLSVEELLAMEPGAAAALGRLRLGYTESEGAPTLRQAIASLYTTVGTDEVLVTSGAEEAIFLFLHALLSRGDEVIVHQPCYQSLAEVARSAGARVVPWLAREDHGWALDPDELSRLAGPAVRGIVLNVPHNPTGWLMARQELLLTARFAERHNIVLFSDEVYRGLEPSSHQTLPAAVDVSPRAASLGVLSKTYGLPGLRIGWIATHDSALLRRIAELKDYTTICASGPSELLAELALRHAPALAARSRRTIEDNLKRLDSFFDRHSQTLSWRRPTAGPVGFPRFRPGDVEAFCQRVREERGVLLAPGALFGDGDDHFRIGFGRVTLPSALAELDQFLRDQETTAG